MLVRRVARVRIEIDGSIPDVEVDVAKHGGSWVPVESSHKLMEDLRVKIEKAATDIICNYRTTNDFEPDLEVSINWDVVEEFEFLQKLAFGGWQQNEPMIVFSVAEGIQKDLRTLNSLKECHAIALKHGLPEIPGYYGIDMNRQFVRV